MAKKDLVKIIEANPGCIAIIDNDCWTLHKQHPQEGPVDDDDAYEKWEKKNMLASSDDDLKDYGDGGYGSGNCYGGDILQALARIAGITVESV